LEIVVNGAPQKKRGKVEAVEVKGAGPASGHGTISIQPASAPHTSFIITSDSPHEEFVAMFGTAFKAMWDGKVIEVTFIPDNTPRAIAVRVI
jgi:hypothetical protein